MVYRTFLQMKRWWELVWAKQGPLKTLTMASEAHWHKCGRMPCYLPICSMSQIFYNIWDVFIGEIRLSLTGLFYREVSALEHFATRYVMNKCTISKRLIYSSKSLDWLTMDERECSLPAAGSRITSSKLSISHRTTSEDQYSLLHCNISSWMMHNGYFEKI